MSPDSSVSPLKWALLGLRKAGSSRYNAATPDEMRDWLDSDVNDSSVKAVSAFEDSQNPMELLRAIRKLDIPRDDVGRAMEVADRKVKYLTHNGSSAKRFRHAYIPALIEKSQPDGEIYMGKSINGKKAMMAWDLNSNNVVVKVDSYEQYEVLGWSKLKDFPSGERQIREQYADKLSDEVFEELVGTNGDGSGNSQKRRSPSAETLTISVGRRHHHKFKLEAKEVAEQFEEQGHLSPKSVKRLVLYPTTTERNLSDNWWIPGSFENDGNVAVANCNKKTYKYLEQYDEVLHVDDYIENARNVAVPTSDEHEQHLGKIDDPIVYMISDQSLERYSTEQMSAFPEVLADAAQSKWKAPDMDGDETVVFLSPSKAFLARPLLHSKDAALYADTQIRDIGDEAVSIGYEYQLYARTRLQDWDWDSPEMTALEERCWDLDFDNGGYEFVETLAKLHDEGKPLYSESPERRWTN